MSSQVSPPALSHLAGNSWDLEVLVPFMLSTFMCVIFFIVFLLCRRICKVKGDASSETDSTIDLDIETGMVSPEIPLCVIKNYCDLVTELLRTAQLSSNNVSDPSTECAICLENWEEEEKKEIKNKWILPQCQHMFHSECICEWLKSCGTTCPICRSNILKVGL
ncbi:hypothetical protein AQUCO_01400770v1 [Aquilegia coerulea]|uniref:RING-type domain-containing protein n=1 Tax=Aquilegia coerulea TaxID=218851 RepID=A0A2G5DXZ2_AQUCA|nr:hypothetical protein AQUCO_01400770v1 [Aquilegia coerulea]